MRRIRPSANASAWRSLHPTRCRPWPMPPGNMLVLVLAGAGMGAFVSCLSPISVAIVVLLIDPDHFVRADHPRLPGGGGAYIVARDNLGEVPAQTAGAALLTDYILTVAVSISSGVAQIVSAFPALYPYRVEISVAMVFLVMLVNLRGCQGIGRDLRDPHLLLPGYDVPDSDRRSYPLPDRALWALSRIPPPTVSRCTASGRCPCS